MLLSAVTNDFGSYRVSMADYRARRAGPDPPTCQRVEPDLRLLKQVEQMTTLVVEGPAGQIPSMGSGPRIYTAIVGLAAKIGANRHLISVESGR
jgi:hypothetical protein